LEFPIEMAGHLYNRAGATTQPVMCHKKLKSIRFARKIMNRVPAKTFV